MTNVKRAVLVAVPAVIASLILGQFPNAADASPQSKTVPGTDGYVVTSAANAEVTPQGIFYPTGVISPNTVVVIKNSDGTLPNGLTPSKLRSMYGEEVRGDTVRAPELEQSAQIAASKYTYLATGASNWSQAYAGPNIIGADAGVKVKYTFSVASGTAQTNAGQGLGYYRGYNGSDFGTWSKWYNLGIADSDGGKTTAVPWGNVAAQTKFRAKCATSSACNGTWSASGV